MICHIVAAAEDESEGQVMLALVPADVIVELVLGHVATLRPEKPKPVQGVERAIHKVQ